jgi:hypothetical protein
MKAIVKAGGADLVWAVTKIAAAGVDSLTALGKALKKRI